MENTNSVPLSERCGDTTPRDRRNLARMTWALAAWAVCFVGVSQLIKRDLLPEGPAPWLLAVLPLAVGVFVLVAYARFLNEADELQRIIQLQALALGFGGSFFALCGYRIFERLGAPAANLVDAALVMVVIYTIAAFVGWRRYR